MSTGQDRVLDLLRKEGPGTTSDLALRMYPDMRPLEMENLRHHVFRYLSSLEKYRLVYRERVKVDKRWNTMWYLCQE